MNAAAELARDGFVVLRGAIPPGGLEPLRAAFDAGVLAADAWPVPRGHDWRHAQVDLDPLVQRVCRLPELLACAGAILGGAFFLSQVEGRKPAPGHGLQPLHRDGEQAATRYAAALAFLDDYGSANGATQVVPGSHRDPAPDAASAITLAGAAGDIVVFDPNLLHGGTTNAAGTPRRSLLISYAAESARESLRASEALRGVRMDTSEVFSGN